MHENCALFFSSSSPWTNKSTHVVQSIIECITKTKGIVQKQLEMELKLDLEIYANAIADVQIDNRKPILIFHFISLHYAYMQHNTKQSIVELYFHSVLMHTHSWPSNIYAIHPPVPPAPELCFSFVRFVFHSAKSF